MKPREGILIAGTTWEPWQLVCACQYGPCGPCERGRHSKSSAEASGQPCIGARIPPESAAAYLVRHRTAPFVLAEVYEIGYRHRWICPCHRAGHGRPGVQLELFDLVAR